MIRASISFLALAAAGACGGEIASAEWDGARQAGSRSETATAAVPYVPPAPLAPVVPVEGEIASGLESPWQLAADVANVYFTTPSASATGERVTSLMACSKAGCGAAPTRLATLRGITGGIVSDGAEVFWTDANPLGGGTAGRIMACAASGCGETPRVVATVGADDQPYAIALVGDTLYWTTGAGYIQRCAKDCRSPETIVRDPAKTSGGGDRPHPFGFGMLWGLTVVGGDLYWSIEGDFGANGPQGAVRTCSLAGTCVPRTLLSGLSIARTIAVSKDTLAVVADGESTVRRCTLPACNDVVKMPLAGQLGLAIDDRRIYWSYGSGGWLQTAALDGSGMTPIVEGQAATFLATDTTHLFWVVTDIPDSRGGTAGTGKIMSRRRAP